MRKQKIRVKIIPDAGHSMSWENPSALAKALAECMG
jgi:pimeloyl-ACP methyl ester carboxylesterase